MKLYWLLLLTLVVAMSGCAGFAPTVSSSGSHFKLKPGVKLLMPKSGLTLISADATTMVLSGDVPEFKPGDIFASELRGGGVRRVVSVSKVGSQTTLTTTLAPLSDAFSELSIKIKGFGKAQLGDLVSKDPHVNFKWLAAPKGKSRTAQLDDILEANFEGFTAGVGTSLSGSANIAFNPDFHLELGKSFDEGFSPRVWGNITATLTAEAAFKYQKILFDDPLEIFPLDPEVPIIWATPSLVITTDLEGEIDGNFVATLSPDVQWVVKNHWRTGTGWTTENRYINNSTGTVSTAVTLTDRIVPIHVQLRFDIDFIAGPYVGAYSKIELQGTDMDNPDDGREVVKATLQTTDVLQAGVSTSPLFETILGFGANAEVDIESDVTTWFSKSFPVHSLLQAGVLPKRGRTNTFNIVYDGAAYDTLPGDFLTFYDLPVGAHTLDVTCTAARSLVRGDNVADFSANLSNGAKFSDGTYNYSKLYMRVGDKLHLDFTVPSYAPYVKKAASLARPRKH